MYKSGPTKAAWALLPVIALATLAAGCGENGATDADYGPLAVIDDSETAPEGGDDALGGTGPLSIGGECVTLENEGGQVLVLAWRASEVEWDEGEIVFTGQGGDVRLSDGDVLSVGGSSLSGEDELEASPDITWASEPDESCDGELWAVHSIVLD